MTIEKLETTLKEAYRDEYFTLITQNADLIIQDVRQSTQRATALRIGMNAPQFSVVYQLLVAQSKLA